MIQKKFGTGMRDILGSCHSLLRHSRAMSGYPSFHIIRFLPRIKPLVENCKNFNQGKKLPKTAGLFTHC